MRLLFRGVIFRLVCGSSSFFSLLASDLSVLKLTLFFSLSCSFLFCFDLGWIFLFFGASLALASLDLGGFLKSRSFTSISISFIFFVLLDMSWVMSTGIPVVGANFGHVRFFVCCLINFVSERLLVECEENDFNLLLRYCFTDNFDGSLLVRPVWTCEAIEDGTSVAVVFLKTLLKHLK